MKCSHCIRYGKHIQAIKQAFKEENALVLRKRSNMLVRSAVLEGDSTLAKLGAVAYCLNKLLTKEHIRSSPRWKDEKRALLNALTEAGAAKTMRELNAALNGFFSKLTKIDKRAARYTQSMFDKAKVKLAADAYFLGLSLSQAAELLGADKKNVQYYIGITRASDKDPATLSIKERLRSFRIALGE
jgi:hypothetical protein